MSKISFCSIQNYKSEMMNTACLLSFLPKPCYLNRSQDLADPLQIRRLIPMSFWVEPRPAHSASAARRLRDGAWVLSSELGVYGIPLSCPSEGDSSIQPCGL